jgi:hypothetical protein
MRRKGANHYRAPMFPLVPSVTALLSPPSAVMSHFETRVRNIPALEGRGDSQILKICRMINVNRETTKRHLPLPCRASCAPLPSAAGASSAADTSLHATLLPATSSSLRAHFTLPSFATTTQRCARWPVLNRVLSLNRTGQSQLSTSVWRRAGIAPCIGTWQS